MLVLTFLFQKRAHKRPVRPPKTTFVHHIFYQESKQFCCSYLNLTYQ